MSASQRPQSSKFGAFVHAFLRLVMLSIPLSLVGYMAFFQETLTLREVILTTFLGLLSLWLVIEVIQKSYFHDSTQQILNQFSAAMHKVGHRLEQIEHSGRQDDSGRLTTEMISELQLMKDLLQTIAQEKTQPPTNETYSFAARPATVESVQPANTRPESELVQMSREELIHLTEEALKANRIEMLMQPIVSLPQRKIRHFECFSRLKTQNGMLFSPENFMGIAEDKNLIRIVDNTLLFRCIQMVREVVKKKFNVNFFLNVSVQTLQDEVFFENLVDFLMANRSFTKHLVIELNESALVKSSGQIEEALRKLGSYGCHFSIDNLTDIHIDLDKLKSHHFQYIKITADTCLKLLETPEGKDQLTHLKLSCDRNNIDLILSHVESEPQLHEFADYQFDYGQGYLFGMPTVSRVF